MRTFARMRTAKCERANLGLAGEHHGVVRHSHKGCPDYSSDQQEPLVDNRTF